MAAPQLERNLGVFGAVMMGMGSIVGTGVFVSIGIAADIAGSSVLLAVMAGALLASFNGLSSAQLAANHPVSGGTYEYGYVYLSPLWGFVAGWLFLLAKSASAATAALGFAGYTLSALGISGDVWRLPLALAALLLLTAIVLAGIRRSNSANIVIVSLTLLALLVFVAAGIPSAWRNGVAMLQPFFGSSQPGRDTLQATALMFVAYTGYGRIATLGEEVHDPRRTIPRAIITALFLTMLLYMAVTGVALLTIGAPALGEASAQAAPLERVALHIGLPGVATLLAIGAVTAMLGVLLNLLLGLSRVLLAMARRGDMPLRFAQLNATGTTPTAAVLAVALLIGFITLWGDVRTTWSFSAFTVLSYYAITNLAALRLSAQQRFFPAWLSWLGLLCCLLLAFFVAPQIWLLGLGLIALGLLWRWLFRRFG